MAWSSIEQNWEQFSRNVKQKWVKLSTRLRRVSLLSQANRLELGKERKSARSGAEVLPSAALCLVHAHSCCKYLRPRRGALQRHVEYSPHRSCLPYSRDKCIPILKWCCRGHLVAQGLLEHGTITLTDLPDHIGGAP